MPTLAEIMAQRKAGAAKLTSKSLDSIKITPESEKTALAANIKRTLDASAPKPLPPLTNADLRELGAMENGERIPMDHPEAGALDKDWQWFDSLHSFESDLGIVIDPKDDAAWLAVQCSPGRPPLLILRLPLFYRPTPGQPF